VFEGACAYYRKDSRSSILKGREMAGSMIELTYKEGRMSSINRAGARESDLPNALTPSSMTLLLERTPGLMMPRDGRASLCAATYAPLPATLRGDR
jgi:hypothetical protein